jgi:hypothetical protein
MKLVREPPQRHETGKKYLTVSCRLLNISLIKYMQLVQEPPHLHETGNVSLINYT